jgi:hypothetical protein
MIDRSEAPAIAALVARPARREWPPYFAGSSPARSASFVTTHATSIGDKPAVWILPCRLSGHISRRMLEHYSHVRMAEKRAALDKLESGLMGGRPLGTQPPAGKAN